VWEEGAMPFGFIAETLCDFVPAVWVQAPRRTHGRGWSDLSGRVSFRSQARSCNEEGDRVRMDFPPAANVLCSLENETITRHSGDVVRSTRDTIKMR